MKQMRKYVAIVCALVMLFSQGVYANEDEVTMQEKEESPSMWAVWDVQMANTYGLGSQETYQGYLESVDAKKFLLVQQSFETKFQVIDETKLDAEARVTRGNVIHELYDIIVPALSIENGVSSQDQALNFFVDNGLIHGRAGGDYELDQECTNEEMLIFARRVYDHIVYELELDAKGAFWKVSDEDNTVYLLGSIHVTDNSTYPLSKDILDAFTSSQALVVEANMLMPNPEDLEYVQQVALLEEGTTIDTLISEETYNAYVEKAEALGLTSEIYNQLKPWYAAMVLQSTNMANASYSATMGIDMYFLYLANGNIPIMEVEGIKYQIDLFDSFSPELQEGYLVSALSDEEKSNELIQEMLNAWKAGNTETLEDMLFTEEEMTDIEKEFDEKLWAERNIHMTEYVQTLLSEDDANDYFFVVGAGHMLNDNGIIEELEALGYEVE